MSSKVLLQLALVTYIANVISEDQYLLVKVKIPQENEHPLLAVATGHQLTSIGDPTGLSDSLPINNLNSEDQFGKVAFRKKSKKSKVKKGAKKIGKKVKKTAKAVKNRVPAECTALGKPCSFGQECCSTRCQPKSQGKPRKKTGRKKRAILGKGKKGKKDGKKKNTAGKPGNAPKPTGKCVAEGKEDDPAPKDCPPGFKEFNKKLPDSMRANYSIIFRNYNEMECREICKESKGCYSYQYSADMHLYNKKDEENGCWVFYEPKGMKVPSRTGTKVDPKSEVACEKLDSGSKAGCKTHKDCKKAAKCVPEKGKGKNNGKISKGKVCKGTQDTCKKPKDCKPEGCKGKKCSNVTKNKPKRKTKHGKNKKNKKARSLGSQDLTDVPERTDCPVFCDHFPRITRPVCGSDGKTYDNECTLRYTRCLPGNEDLLLVSQGKCAEETVTERICCRAGFAMCLACSAGLSVEEYCNRNPTTTGCEDLSTTATLSNLCKDKKCGDVCDTSHGMLTVMRYCQPDLTCGTNSMPECDGEPEWCEAVDCTLPQAVHLCKLSCSEPSWCRFADCSAALALKECKVSCNPKTITSEQPTTKPIGL